MLTSFKKRVAICRTESKQVAQVGLVDSYYAVIIPKENILSFRLFPFFLWRIKRIYERAQLVAGRLYSMAF